MTERKVCFSFGALSDDFSTQLKQQGYELKNKEKLKKQRKERTKEMEEELERLRKKKKNQKV